jgi:hypothetical protein
MTGLRYIVLAFLAGFAASPASARQGWAIYFGEEQPCRDRVLVATDHGRAFVYWPTRPRPRSGEDVTGDFQTIGWQEVSGMGGRTYRVYVEAVGLSFRQEELIVHDCIMYRATHRVGD